MSYFCGCQKALVMKKDLMIIIVLLNLLMCSRSCLSLRLNTVARSNSMAANINIDDHDHDLDQAQPHDDNINPLNQLIMSSSREDMVQIAGYGEDKLSTVLITGSVHCEEACNLNSHGHQLHLLAWPLSGALVSVNCHVGGRKRKSSVAQGVTDEFGDFIIDLPSDLHAIPNLDKTCSVRVVGIPKNTQCRPAYVRRNKGLKLSSVGNGIRTYNAGTVRFQHLTSQPSQACFKKASNNKQMLLS